MAKYVYLSYVMPKPELTSEVFLEKVRPRMENEEVEYLAFGPAIGVQEDYLHINSTDLGLKEFIDFRTEAFTVDGKDMIDHARTITIINYRE
ncbi:MAG: hypothetical protein NWE89_08160 [Candidatus Bathyarchaeota archaeon]|nr:hypothetical protein [Candidatus Bathyarchaeota archaeon]